MNDHNDQDSASSFEITAMDLDNNLVVVEDIEFGLRIELECTCEKTRSVEIDGQYMLICNCEDGTTSSKPILE